MRRRLSWLAVTIIVAGLAFMAGSRFQRGGRADEPAPPSLAAKADGILARALAHSEIGQWEKAGRLFRELRALLPDDPVPAINLSVVAYRTGHHEEARRWLDEADAGGDRMLQARIEYYRGKLHYEQASLQEEFEAYRRAAAADPTEPTYAFALAQQYLRMRPLQQKPLVESLERAHGLWPSNTRIAVEWALWAARAPDPAVRRRALDALRPFVESAADPAIREAFRAGTAAVLEREGPATSLPARFHAACNLLRSTARFRGDAEELESRLRGRPLRRLASWRLRTRQAFLSPLVHFAPAATAASAQRVLHAALVDDAVDPPVASTLVTASGGELRWPGRATVPVDSPPRALRTGDLDGDGRMEVVLVDGKGIVLHGAKPSVRRSGRFRDAALVDFDHDSDLDICVLTEKGELAHFLNRGSEGIDESAAPLLLGGRSAWTLLATADLDGDHDQDLVLAGERGLDVYLNRRQGVFTHHKSAPLPAAPRQLLVLDYSGDGRPDLVVLTQDGLLFLDGELRPDRTAQGCAEPLRGRLEARQVRAADIDLDGDLDLLVCGKALSVGTAAVVALENRGQSYFLFEPGLLDERLVEADGMLMQDVDGDQDKDLHVWSVVGGLRTFLCVGPERRNRIALHLRAPRGKVPLDAKGVTVDFYAGGARRSLQVDRPNVVLGLGSAEASLVKATWPNGISEYLFDPEANRDHTLTLVLRLEGSCPFLYARDGASFRFVTDILGLSPLGLQVAPGVYAEPDPGEYLRLPDWLEPVDGKVELRITEELREVTYLDQVELIAVDTPPAVEAFSGEQWVLPPVRGLALRLLGPLMQPVSVRAGSGREVSDIVAREDQRYLTGFEHRSRYQGMVEEHSLTITLPAGGRWALVLVGWLHWANTSVNVARGQDRATPAGLFPVLEVADGAGGWKPAGTAGLPAGKTKPVVLVPDQPLDPADPRIRLTTNFEVSWDRIAVARPLQDAEHRVHRLPPAEAELRFGGFARWYRPAAGGPYLFDYRERRPYPWRVGPDGSEIVLSWQELEGRCTAYGPVRALLREADDLFVVFGSGEEVALAFDATRLPPPPDGWRRTWFVHFEGWEKDGDFNVASSQTVAPLPFRAMRGYPYDGFRPARPELARTLTRSVSRHRLERRVRAERGR